MTRFHKRCFSISINGFVWNGTLAVAGLVFAFSWGYNLARAYRVNDLAGRIVGVATLIQGIAFSYSTSVATAVPTALMDEINAGSATSGWSATADASPSLSFISFLEDIDIDQLRLSPDTF